MLWHKIQGAGGLEQIEPFWDVSTATFIRSATVLGGEQYATGITFRDDGRRMYIVGREDDEINQYSLSTAWDISTREDDGDETVGGDPTDVFFKPDGTRFYVCAPSSSGYSRVSEYSLSTAWSISSRTLVRILNVSGTGDNPQGLFFKPDGTKMYVTAGVYDSIYEYSLSTAWDISTASLDSTTSVSAQASGPFAIYIRSDGRQMFISDTGTDSVYQYTLTTPWDTSTRSYDSISFSVAAKETSPDGMWFSPDGAYMYIVGTSSDQIHQYSLS